MGVLVACKNEEDPIKMKALEWSQHYSLIFSDTRGQLTPKSVMESCRKSNSSKLFMVGLVTCKNEEDPSKNEGTRVVQNIFPIISLWGFFQTRKGS